MDISENGRTINIMVKEFTFGREMVMS